MIHTIEFDGMEIEICKIDGMELRSVKSMVAVSVTFDEIDAFLALEIGFSKGLRQQSVQIFACK